MADQGKFHPAITVNNIKNLIPITLDMDTSKYNYCSQLFIIHCRAFQVLQHILPTPNNTTTGDSSSIITNQTTPTETWDRLDAIVLQWIYGTISIDLLETIMSPDTTATKIWERIKSIFNDNQSSHVVHLQQKFNNIRLDNFPNVSAYYQEQKVLADQHTNVGPALKDDCIVLQLITGLNENYEIIASQLSHTHLLPSF
ncbi:uncharacterized protein [Rutidosis leptorrhynchoides]|uniref:uncharacterized protein n=1 Tax=Rutidosis leptorrhynchoides TaxID=125765 RepID=UPI003A996DD3